ncbi:LLM class flavin-dependent oxidoreductase [Streptomyces tateyamensis]|uniref:LLM class flavin-dependent oxidoreductase n=1 Tax=Streptomyces tateyamensis TaxID=565073 RepID=A0A2V4NG27_9ACTN|nr:LLM class flavin-dependent oxidoreductase [Streptomyces tateyamensis]PYC83785.1 LLM class flavin-dependent oxidoreductase [Streptomyces tateyamensis]
MEFGITFFPTIGPDDRPADQYFDECLALAELADELGLHHVRTVEHYFFEYGGYSPDPVTFLAAAAARTRRIRLGTSAVIPAFTHPVKLAGKLAMLDNISHGRLDVGFGRAFLPDEFEAFQVPMDESHIRFQEGIEACKRLWSEKAVVWEGTHHRFGPVTLLPRPVQQPHPPVYVTTARSLESCEAAGRNGHNLQMVGAILTREQIQERLAAYRKAWVEAGHEPGAERVQLSYPAFLSEDADQALRIATYDEGKGGERIGAAVSSWSSRTSQAYPGYEKLADQALRPTVADKIRDNKVLAGTPQQVCEQLAQISEWFGNDVIISVAVHSGQLSFEDAERTVRLLAEQVAPKFR